MRGGRTGYARANASGETGVGAAGADELRALLLLRQMPGIADARIRRLLDRYGSAGAALAAERAALAERCTGRQLDRARWRAERALHFVDRLGLHVLCYGAADYPPQLAHLPDPPCVLFGRGRRELLERRLVAVVGSRRHTVYGVSATRMIVELLTRVDAVVISGLAHGIDAVAHEAALEAGAGVRGGTIAVLGCGIDVVYPQRNERLQERIATEGLLLSEFLPGEPALPHNFPRRNRIIAALAHVVIVVEAPAKSGALITAHHALDLNREIFAVPGPIGRATSEGTNELIREGAHVFTDIEHVLYELGVEAPADATPANATADHAAGEPPALPPAPRALWRLLDEEPRHIDELAAAAGLSPGAALTALLELELAGAARQVPGQQYVRV